MRFKLGDMVVCIRGAVTWQGPKFGQAYTVTYVDEYEIEIPDGYHQVGLLELGNLQPEWYSDRFVLVSSLTKLEKCIYNLPYEENET